MKTLQTIDIKDKIVVIRCDLNVPHKDGQITDETRIKASIPTLKYLLDNGAKEIHILTHLGRPKGQVVPELSAKILQKPLADLLGEPVSFNETYESNGEKVQLHENVRFDPTEKKNGNEMIAKLMQLKPDLFVLDAFGTAHRQQASVVGLADKVPSVAGLLMESEITAMSPYLSQEKVPGLTIIVGGAKMDTKIGILEHFAKTAENIIVGGALANTFLHAQGFDVGQSLYQEEKTEKAMEIMAIADASGCGFHIPVDVMCADDITDQTALDVPTEDVMGDMKIFDIGPHSVASFKEIIMHSSTIIWNGPMGVNEFKPFENGTKGLLEGLAATKAKVIVGGGDSIAAITQFGYDFAEFTHVSTGGGAMLELLEGKELPGVKAVS